MRLQKPISLVLSGLAIVASAVAMAQLPVEVVPGELLIGMKSHNLNVMTAPAQDPSVASIIGMHPTLGVMRVRVAPGFSLQQAAARLRSRPDVAYVEPNGIYHTTSTPNDTNYSSQYAPPKVQADLAWGIWKPQAQVIIAIVDTGIDYNHPDLTNKILRSGGAVVGYNALGSNARSGVGTDPIDDQGHGTHCAGIAAAQVNNGVGVAGIAGWDGNAANSDTTYTKLMPVKVLSSTGSGTDASVAAGITWAADHGAKVISMSLGGGGSTTLQNAVAYAVTKGCVIAAAAGNSASSTKSYPAGYPSVLAVAATDNTDTLASYSNFGTWVNVAAPGSAIYSTLPIVSTGGGFGLNYGTLSGTSMATPHVAGEAALILAQNPALTASQVNSIITGNVDAYSPYAGRTIGSNAGRINVYKALLAAGGSPPPPPAIPAAPTGLAASAGNAQVTLSWTASSGATSYNVKQAAVSGGPYTTIGTTAGTSFTSTGLTNGTPYYFVVSAVNSSGESANSSQATATPVAPAAGGILNPGFESGATFAPWSASAGVVTNSKSEPAHGGTWYAWLCGYGSTHTDTLNQQFTLPSSLTSASLSFYLHIDTAETTKSIAYDTLKVQITNASGTVLATLGTYSNLDKAAGYTLKKFDISAFKGQTIKISLVATEDSSLQTSFVVDDFALTIK